MKKYFLLGIFAFFLLAKMSFALTLYAPEKIPENSSWTFSVVFQNLCFDNANIKLNDKLIAVVYPYASCSKVIVEKKDPALLGYSNNNNSFSFSVSSLRQGNYSLSVTVFKDGQTINSETASIVVFPVLPEAYRQQVESSLSSLDSKIKETKTTVQQTLDSLKKEVETKLAETENNVKKMLEETKSQVEQRTKELEETTLKKLETIQKDLNETKKTLDAYYSSFTKLYKETMKKLRFYEEKVRSLEESNKSTLSTASSANASNKSAKSKTGMFSLAERTAYLSILSLALILLLFFLIIETRNFFEKNKEAKQESESSLSFGKSFSTEDSKEQQKANDYVASTEEDISSTKKTKWKGKWAYPYDSEEDKPKIRLGDLIKRS